MPLHSARRIILAVEEPLLNRPPHHEPEHAQRPACGFDAAVRAASLRIKTQPGHAHLTDETADLFTIERIHGNLPDLWKDVRRNRLFVFAS